MPNTGKLTGVYLNGQSVDTSDIGLTNLDSTAKTDPEPPHSYPSIDTSHGSVDPPHVVDDSSNALIALDEPPELIMRRGVPLYDGVYLVGTVNGVETLFCVDTGASSSLVSFKVFDQIPDKDKPSLRPTHKYRMADGQTLPTRGRATFTVRLGDLTLERDWAVAGITDDVLLGADTLQNDSSGSADLLLSEQRMVLRGTSIPLLIHQVPKLDVRTARAADHHIIPPMSEMLVDVYVDNQSESDEDLCVLVESAPQVNGFAVAASLANVRDNTTIKVRVMNPYPEPVSLKQDSIVGLASPCEDLQSVLCTESSDVSPLRARRISFNNGSETESVREVHTRDQRPRSTNLPEHLVELYERTIEGKSPAEAQALFDLLDEFQDSFSIDSADLGCTHLGEHVIVTGDASPIKQPPRRTPLAFEGEDRAALDKLQQQGSVRPSTSPWASPIVLVRKKDGTVRPCVDYRRLNTVTKPDAFPLPRTDDCLDAMAGATFFSTLDITSAYNQIPVKEEDIPKTAFATKFGLFEYTTMPFGLSNAPATFQRIMELALRGLQWTSCIIYLDDVIIYGQTLDEHMSRLRMVLTRLREAGLKLSPKKCFFLNTEVAFLGHLVSGDGVLPNPDNVNKLVHWPQPKNLTEVRGLIGLGSYYRRFVKDFAHIVKPLVHLTKKGVPFEWTTECELAFDKLKAALVSPEVMGYPHNDCSFILDTDACDVSIGAVLSQLQEGRERVIAYASRSLSKSERNYCVTDKELLAVVNYVQYYKHYLLGRKFLVRTDHQALRWLFSLKEPKNRVARWIEILSAFEFSVEYRPGTKHGNADGMSRCPEPRDCSCDVSERETIACGPCPKCQKRTMEMLGNLPGYEYEPARRSVIGDPELVQPNSCEQTWLSTLSKVVGSLWTSKQGHANSNPGSTNPPVSPQTEGQPKMEACGELSRRVQTRSASKATDRTTLPDANQRPPPPPVVRNPLQWATQYSANTLRGKQLDDPNVGTILRWVEEGQRPFGSRVCSSSPETRHYWNNWCLLRERNGVLYRQFLRQDGSGDHLQLIVPKSLRSEVMKQMHESVLSGHLGKRKTREKTLQRFYWFCLRDDVNAFVRRCDSCAANKPPAKPPRAPLGDLRVGAPMDRLATDILGPLPTTPRGNRYVLIVTDYFTNWVEVLPVPDQTAETCAEKILNEIIARFGCPLDLHSDQGANYRSQIFKELCRLLEIRKTRTSARNPKCNGKVERFNRTLVRMIRAYLKGQQREWDRQLGCLAAAYRATPHEGTGLTPNLLMLGREVRLPAEIMFGSGCSEGEITSYGDYVDSLRHRMQHAHDLAREHQGQTCKSQKDRYDGKTMLHKYQPGDYVWYLSEKRKVGENPKLYSPYEGPYVVLHKMSDLVYEIQYDPQRPPRVTNHNKLKPYEGSVHYKWAKNAVAKRQDGKRSRNRTVVLDTEPYESDLDPQ